MIVEVFIPAIGQQELVDQTIRHLTYNSASHSVGYYIIDNASKVPIIGKGVSVIRNEENLGMVRSLQQAVENSEADIIVYLHSDMFIYEEGWDEKLVEAFHNDPKLAAVGVVGAIQADANGGRSGTICAFRGGNLHGEKPRQFLTPVALLDGCFMAFRRAYLENLDWDQFEENGYYFYDKDLTLTLTMKSLHVAVINFDCEHLGGQTSCRPEFVETLEKQGENHDSIYARSEARYLNKWKDVLPVRVRSDYHVDVKAR